MTPGRLSSLLTSQTENHLLDFVNARLGGVDTTGSQAPLMNSSSNNTISFVPFFLGGSTNSSDSGASSDSSVAEPKHTQSDLNIEDDDDVHRTQQNKSVDDVEEDKDEMPFSSVKVASDGSVHINGWFVISMIFISITVILIFWLLISAILRRRRANRNKIDAISSSRLPVWASRGRSYGRVSNPKGREESPVWDIEKSAPQADHDSELLPYPDVPKNYEEPRYQGGGL